MPVDTGLDDAHWNPPTWDEFLDARRQLTSGKAPDSSGMHVEMLKCLPTTGTGLKVLQAIHELVRNFWLGRLTDVDLKTWHTSTLFPIQKGKGEFHDLQNWRGVGMLDIFSKLPRRILNKKN